MTNQRKNIFQIPTTDFSFKKIFGTERNKRFLIRFLNCFVSKYTGEIVDVTYLPTEHYGMVEAEKKAVFDLLCKDAEDRQFVIEMQKAPQPDYAERSIFYLSRAISASLARGQLDYEILPSYSVNILDFDLQEYRKKDQFFHAVFLKDQNNEILTQKVGIFFIKLCNFAARQHWRYRCQQSYGLPPGKSSTQIIASSEHPVRGAGTGRTGMPAMSSSHAVGVRASGDNLGYRVQ